MIILLTVAIVFQVAGTLILVGLVRRQLSLAKLSLSSSPKPPVTAESCLLSVREREILDNICDGLSNREIADRLSLSKRTVDKHRANILEKTACRNTAELVVYAVRNRLFTRL